MKELVVVSIEIIKWTWYPSFILVMAVCFIIGEKNNSSAWKKLGHFVIAFIPIVNSIWGIAGLLDWMELTKRRY